MARKNIIKKNSVKTKNSTKKKTKANSNSENSSFSLIEFFKSSQFKNTFGIFLILFSLLLLVAFLSYFSTWKDDAAIYESGFWSSSLNENLKSKNFAGKFGGWLAYVFIKRWFGIASFLFIPGLVIIGLKLLSVNIKRFNFFILSLISFLIYISVFVASVFPNSENPFMGGIFGSQAVKFIKLHIGNPGLILALIFTGITLVSIVLPKLYSLIVEKIKSKFSNLKNRKSSENDEISEENQIAANQRFSDENHEIEEAENKAFSVNKNNEDLNFELKKTEKTELSVNSETEQRADNIIEFEVNEPAKVNKSDNKESDSDIPFEIIEVQNEVVSNDEVSTEEDEEGKPKYGDINTPYDPRKDLESFVLPTADLLEDYGTGKINIDKQELEANKVKIENTLQNYGIKIDKIFATVGPTVTLYEIVPAPGIRISKIKNLEDDIALSLAALGIRIIAPIPGKGTIGIEVPNKNAEIVSLKSLITSPQFLNTTFDLPIALGKTITNDPYIADLSKMPHLLMAGATGQGKSVGLNTIIASLLFKKHPAELKFVLVDPKKVELPLFAKIERHYLAKLPDAVDAIITDTSLVVKTLKGLTIEMDNRYDLLKDASCRNIKEYNEKFINRKLNPEKGHLFLPYIVLIVDEFADLIMTAGKEVEGPIARIAQLARAVGIHLVIATQRPSVNIITGVIKANFPARMAFRVSAKVDSRTILDASGADQLIGRGDMLLSNGSRIDRVQCAFIDTPELEKIAEFIGSQRGYPSAFELPEVASDEDEGGKKEFISEERDVLFADAARIIVQNQHGSTSLLQRKLKLGYNRAGRLIDQLEAAGIVGPFEGSKAREVLIRDMDSLEQLLIMYNAN